MSEKIALPKNAIGLAIAQIEKAYPNSLFRLGQRTVTKIPTIQTGNPLVDFSLLGVGGMPRGRISEIYGPESSGKTTFCLSVIAAAQNAGGVAAFIDVEHALDPKFARVMGVNIDDLLVSQPDNGEDALNIGEILIRSGAVDVVVFDSVAALVTKAELDGAAGDVTMGGVARLMSQAMRRLTAVVSKTNCVVIFTNQIREKIGVMFGSPETTPGGRALKFFASIRLDIRRKDPIKTPEGKVIGNRIKIKAVKNKCAPPFTEVEMDLLFTEGISRTGAILDLALEHKIIEKKAAWFSFQGELLGQGRETVCQLLKDNTALCSKIYALIQDRIKFVQIPVQPVSVQSTEPTIQPTLMDSLAADLSNCKVVEPELANTT